MVVGERNTGDRVTVELITVVNGIATSSEQVVVHLDIRDRTEIIVDHYSRGLTVVVDDGVVANRDVGVAAIDLNAIIVRRTRRLEAVDVIVLNQPIVALRGDTVFDVVDIAPENRRRAAGDADIPSLPVPTPLISQSWMTVPLLLSAV